MGAGADGSAGEARCHATAALLVRAFYAIHAALGLYSGWVLVSLTTLAADLGLSATAMALLLAMDNAAYVAAAVPVAHLLQHNIPRWSGAGLLASVGTMVVIAGAQSGTVLVAASVGIGLGKLPLQLLGEVHLDDNIADKRVVPQVFG
eukprot:gene2359-59043_t